MGHPSASLECWVSIPFVNGFSWAFYLREGGHDEQSETWQTLQESESAELRRICILSSNVAPPDYTLLGSVFLQGGPGELEQGPCVQKSSGGPECKVLPYNLLSPWGHTCLENTSPLDRPVLGVHLCPQPSPHLPPCWLCTLLPMNAYPNIL